MEVDRCVCKRVPFRALIQQADLVGGSLRKLSAITGCGVGCAMCVPYALIALKTGKDRVPVMSDREMEAVLGSPVPRTIFDLPREEQASESNSTRETVLTGR